MAQAGGDRSVIVITARNVHDALPKALRELHVYGVRRDSRNGPVIVFPEPVTTVYEKPLERVLFYPERDANPFFHFAESLWMLAGRNDVAFLAKFVPSIKNYSDDGEVFRGAYGHRWRKAFGVDQLPLVIEALKKDRNDRRQVVVMSHACDLEGQETNKDVPCNTQAMFSVHHSGQVDMLVTNRSNDMIWGCYGANAVHFSYLHEFVAAGIGLPVGYYRQMSNNLHAYDNEVFAKVQPLLSDETINPYANGHLEPVTHRPLMSCSYQEWTEQLEVFLVRGAVAGMDPFFRRVAGPILRAHAAYSLKKDRDRFNNAQDELLACTDTAWRKACMEWVTRRWHASLRAPDAGVQHGA
jgi:thymidylate synthase